eukprot:s58_g44.t1
MILVGDTRANLAHQKNWTIWRPLRFKRWQCEGPQRLERCSCCSKSHLGLAAALISASSSSAAACNVVRLFQIR